MKIVVVGPTYPYRGGIAHHTTLLVRHLREKHSVEFISFKSQYPSWLFPGRSDRDPSQEPLWEPCQYLLSPLNPLSWLDTARRIRLEEPELLIIPWWVPFWAPAWTVLSRVARIGKKTKIVYICHNVLPHERKWWDQPLARMALSSGDNFIVHSQQDANQLNVLLSQPKYLVTPLPAHRPLEQHLPDQAASRRDFGLDAQQPVLLFFGFVRPYKGLDVLLDAMFTVQKDLPSHLLVVGEMWGNEQVYRQRVDNLGLAQVVTIENRYVPNEELGRYFAAADVVVLPYRSATQSGVVQLAFGFGKPVITTQVGGLAEAVIDNVNGLVVPPGNPDALAEAITRFFKKGLGPALTAGVAAHQHHFSWDRLVHAIEELDPS